MPDRPAPSASRAAAALLQAEGRGGSAGRYRQRLYSGVPLFSTRLVREGEVPLSARESVKALADVAAILGEYFADRDREELVAKCLPYSTLLRWVI